MWIIKIAIFIDKFIISFILKYYIAFQILFLVMTIIHMSEINMQNARILFFFIIPIIKFILII